MPPEEEGVREVSGEPRGRVREPKQNPHRGTESPQRLVLPQIRVKAPAGGGWAGGARTRPLPLQARTVTQHIWTPLLLFLLLSF